MAYDSLPLDILPGIFKEASEYASQGRFSDGSNVRFWKGFPERIGGNTRIVAYGTYRPTRAINAWRSLNGTQLIAFGHARGVQVFFGSTLYDPTPTGTGGYSTLTVQVGAITSGPYQTGETVTTANGATGKLIQASASSPLLVSGDNGTVKLALTGMSGTFAEGESISFSGGGSARVKIGGASSPIYLYDVTGATTGTITGAITGATGTFSSVTTLWTGTLTGGTSGATSTISSVAETNAIDSGATTPWGGSTWGTSVWGGADSLFSTITDAKIWSFANWGEDLIAVPRGGSAYVLDTSVFVGAPTTTKMSAISGAPANALGCMLNSADRTLILYGAHDGSASDPLNIRWSNSEDYTVWTADPSNTAGSIRCNNGSLIRGMMQGKDTFLVSTDTALYTFRYVGLPFVFSLNQVATGSVLIGPNAWAEQDGITYWMGDDGFFQFDGAVYPLPCDVHQYVFARLNAVQNMKVFCVTLRAYNEIWWFYVSTSSTMSEVDSYVCFNTVEKTWHIGDKSRTACLDKSLIVSYPIGVKADGTIQAEEYGTTDNGTAISYSLTTSDVEVNDAQTFLQARVLYPDYNRISGSHALSILCRGYPARSSTTKGPYTLTSASEKISVRARGRVMQFKWTGSDDFRMGRWRYKVTGHGENV
jgi:hypothetical protein